MTLLMPKIRPNTHLTLHVQFFKATVYYYTIGYETEEGGGSRYHAIGQQ